MRIIGKDINTGTSRSVQNDIKGCNTLQMNSEASLELELRSAEERIAAMARNQILRTKVRILNQHMIKKMLKTIDGQKNNLKILNDKLTPNKTLYDEKKNILGNIQTNLNIPHFIGNGLNSTIGVEKGTKTMNDVLERRLNTLRTIPNNSLEIPSAVSQSNKSGNTIGPIGCRNAITDEMKRRLSAVGTISKNFEIPHAVSPLNHPESTIEHKACTKTTNDEVERRINTVGTISKKLEIPHSISPLHGSESMIDPEAYTKSRNNEVERSIKTLGTISKNFEIPHAISQSEESESDHKACNKTLNDDMERSLNTLGAISKKFEKSHDVSQSNNSNSITNPKVYRKHDEVERSREDTSHKCTQRLSADEELERSRERNRIHSRSTRKRKKERLQNLEYDVDCLRKEQMHLIQVINDENTGGVCRNNFGDRLRQLEPEVDKLLNRSPDDIPSISKEILEKDLPELPTYTLPRKKRKTCGIDDRDNGFTASQLEEIRKERNRLHAKRTRDKKRVYIKEMKSLKMLLERENHILREHVEMLRDHKRNHPNLPKSITTSRISTLVDKHGL